MLINTKPITFEGFLEFINGIIYAQASPSTEHQRITTRLSSRLENYYAGIPTLVIEVLYPSTVSKDFIEKMNVYMRFGVKEYWIV